MKKRRFLIPSSLWLVLLLPVPAWAQTPPDETYPVEYKEESQSSCAYQEEYIEKTVITTETDWEICKAEEDALGCEGAVVAMAGPAAPVVGNLQSPIDLFQVAGVPAAPWQFELRNYHNQHAWNVVLKHGHNVYEIQHFAWPWKPFAWVNGRQYLLRQFHCHNGPEHAVRGNPMNAFFECHFVHEHESSGDKAVLGVYLLVPPPVNYVVPPQIHLPPGLLVPCAPWKYTYWGSLTAPPDGVSPAPYPEGVAWAIPWDAFKHIPLDLANYLYRTAPHPVLRGLQPRNGREIRIIP